MKEGLATIEEIDRHWSIDDVTDANEVLDAWHEAERLASKRAGPK